MKDLKERMQKLKAAIFDLKSDLFEDVLQFKNKLQNKKQQNVFMPQHTSKERLYSPYRQGTLFFANKNSEAIQESSGSLEAIQCQDKGRIIDWIEEQQSIKP